MLGLAALQKPQHRVTILRYVANFGFSYSNTLQYLASPEAVSGWAPVTAAAMSSAFAAMKIWILLACYLDNDGDPGSEKSEEAFTFERMVWNETWPPFEKIIHVSMSLSLDSASVRIDGAPEIPWEVTCSFSANYLRDLELLRGSGYIRCRLGLYSGSGYRCYSLVTAGEVIGRSSFRRNKPESGLHLLHYVVPLYKRHLSYYSLLVRSMLSSIPHPRLPVHT